MRFIPRGLGKRPCPLHSPRAVGADSRRPFIVRLLALSLLLLGIFHTAYFATTASYLEYSKLHTLELQLLTRLPPELIGYCILLTAQIMPTFFNTYHIVCQMSMCWVYAVWFEVILVQLLTFLAPEHRLHCTLYSFHLKAYLLLRLLVRCISYIVAPLC